MDLVGRDSGHRERVILFLAFLTSKQCLDLCMHEARPEELAAELSRIWFDDIYMRGDSYLDGLKGDLSAEEIARFESCFSEGELETLERFHGFFELRIGFLANRQRGLARFPDNDSWRSLVRHADHVLSELAADPDHLRTMLAAVAARKGSGLRRLAEAMLDSRERPDLSD